MLNVFTSSDEHDAFYGVHLKSIDDLFKDRKLNSKLYRWYASVDSNLKGIITYRQFIDQFTRYLILHDWLCCMANDENLNRFKKILGTKKKDWLFEAKRELYLRFRNGIQKNQRTQKIDNKLSKDLSVIIQYLNI